MKLSGTNKGNRWELEQKESGIYIATITYPDGDVSAITTDTAAKCAEFFINRDVEIYNN